MKRSRKCQNCGRAYSLKAWREGTFFERFLTGWLAWSLVSVTVYPGADADLALMVTVPAVGLTVSFALRLLQTAQYGFWEVPNWLIPLHAIAVAAFLVSLGTNIQSLSTKLYDEAKIVDFAKVLEVSTLNGNSARIGTLKPGAESSSMAITLPLVHLVDCQDDPGDRPPESIEQNTEGKWCERQTTTEYTVQVIPIDAESRDAQFIVKNPETTIIHGPDKLGDELRFVFRPEMEGEYRLDLLNTETGVQNFAQYLVLIFPGDVTDDAFFESLSSRASLLSIPTVHAGILMMSRPPNSAAVVIVLMLALIIPITFFLTGAFYGARAAWRGVAFGFLLYTCLYGLALGWQATTLYGGDIRELWYRESVTDDYRTVADVLTEYSRRENGTDNLIAVTVEGQPDSPLRLALRDFPHAHFVDEMPPTTNTPAAISPDTLPRPMMGREYVGQQLIFGYAWNLDSLNWTDFGSWLFNRRTRFDPVPAQVYRIWIAKEVYDVENVPAG